MTVLGSLTPKEISELDQLISAARTVVKKDCVSFREWNDTYTPEGNLYIHYYTVLNLIERGQISKESILLNYCVAINMLNEQNS